MKPLTPQDIAELRKLEDAATPAPWTVLMGEPDQPHAFVQGPHQGYDGEFPAADTQLIVSARNALPRLLDEVERWRNPETIKTWRNQTAADLDRARTLLKRIEWQGFGADAYGEGGGFCPCCHGDHLQSLDCELAALLGPAKE